MTAFVNLHRLQSFKDSFRLMIDLDETDRRIVLDAIQATEESFGGDDQGPGDDELDEAYSVLRTIRLIAGDFPLDEIRADIESVYPDPEDLEKIDKWFPYFSPSAGEVELAFTREVEGSSLPVGIASNFTLDYRVAVRNSGAIAFVPLFLARVSFDEHVAGSDATIFQLSESAMLEMRDRIDAALGMLRESAPMIGADRLPGAIVRKYLGTDEGEPE